MSRALAVRAGLALLAVVVLALVAAQLVLPGVAERRIADDLRGTADVRDVRVEALPAVRLLAHRADRVEVRLGEARASGTGALGDLVATTRDAEEVDARAESLLLGPLALRDLRFGKRGEALDGRATLADDALAAALPASVGFEPIASGDGELVFEATAGLLGLQATVRARLSAQDGALVIAPEGVPFGGLATFTIFEDPRVEVTGVGARRTGGGYALTATGRLAGG